MNKLKKQLEDRRNRTITVALVMVFLTLLVGCSLSSNIWSPCAPQLDDSVFRYVGMVMQNGGIPYKDTFDHKGPLIYLINYLGLYIDPNGIWFFELAGIFFTALMTYKSLSLFVDLVPSLLGTSLVILQLYSYLGGGNYTEEYALSFITCSLYIYIDYFLKGETSRLKLVACGACFMAVMLLRANMIAVWIVFSLAVLADEIRSNSKKWIEYLVYFALGAGTLLIPFIIYFAINDAMGDFWEDYIIFNLSYTGTSVVSKEEAIRTFLWSAPCAISVIVSGIRILTKNNGIKIDIINLLYIALCVYMIGMGGRTYNHYGIILIPLTIIPIARVLQYVCEKGMKKRLVAGAAIALAIMCLPWLNQTLNKGINTTSPEQTLEGIISTFIRENTDEDDLIIQCGHKDVFYVLSDRMAASRYSYPLPIAQVNNEVYDEFFYDLEMNKPIVIITDSSDEQGQLDYTEINRRLEVFLNTHRYVQGPTIETYSLYFAPGSMLASERLDIKD